MNKLALSLTANPTIPLIGVPLKGYSNTYVATTLGSTCIVKALYRWSRCKEALDTAQYVNGHSLSMLIRDYVNRITSELLDMCLDGHIDIECSERLPDVTLFVIGTTEVVFNLFKIKRIDYEEYLKTLAAVDHRFWGVDPSYIATLRCSYLFRKTCVCRNVYDMVMLAPLDVNLEYVEDLSCGKQLCLELDPPFDHLSMMYMVKFASHIISKISHDILSRGVMTNATLKHLNLLHGIETQTVLEAVNYNPMVKPASCTTVKPVADIRAIRLYRLNIRVSEDTATPRL